MRMNKHHGTREQDAEGLPQPPVRMAAAEHPGPREGWRRAGSRVPVCRQGGCGTVLTAAWLWQGGLFLAADEVQLGSAKS